MKIRHLRTKEELDINFNEWETDYVSRGRDTDYEILTQNTVFLRLKNKDGTRTFFKEVEKEDAIEFVRREPSKYEYLEQEVPIHGITLITRHFIGASFDDFKTMIRDSLSGRELDEAFFHMTGKFPPSSGDNINTTITQTKSPRIFKLSIGPGEIEHRIYLDLLDEKLATVHKSTRALATSKKTQFQDFTEARIGDFFYLCRGNQQVVLLGQFTDDLFYTLGPELKDWGLRKYRVVEMARENNGYNGEKKWWTPNYNSTFAQIPRSQYRAFNELIFSVFFESDFNTTFNQNIDKRAIEEPETPSTRVISSIYGSSYSISENVTGVIGVKQQALELAELLANLKSEKGMMVGLFGRWGRGKTFFWNEIIKHFDTTENKPFLFAEFHSWKYQDTPASWAYLYESITKACIKHSEYYTFLGINVIRKNVLRLNISKYGLFPLISFGLFFLASITWFFIIPFDSKLEWSGKILRLIISLGSATLTALPIVLFYKRNIPKAIDLFRKYSRVVSFKNLLGLQSEIQNELIKVLKASFTDADSQRLLLFVDDLDRCSEDRIVQIIDSLKVMLEDREIAERVIVLTAIDERILKRAIAHKYYDSVQKNFIKKADQKKVMETLVREYMDKLFISGIKLTNLNTLEKEQIFDAYSKNQDKVHFREKENTEADETNQDLTAPVLPKTNVEEVLEALGTQEFPHEGSIELTGANPDYEIEEFEYDYLKLVLKHHIDATPRSIRIYYFRYLLAKKFLALQLPQGSVLRFVWEIFDEKKILAELIIYYSTEKNLDDLAEQLKKLQLENDHTTELEMFGNYSLNRALAVELIKIVEIVVAY